MSYFHCVLKNIFNIVVTRNTFLQYQCTSFYINVQKIKEEVFELYLKNPIIVTEKIIY